MPTYDFRCRDCGAVREVRAGHEVAGQLELICTSCGGSVVKAFAAAALLRSDATHPPSPSSPSRGTRHRRGGDSCDAAIHLTRPNPFARGLPGRDPGPGDGRA